MLHVVIVVPSIVLNDRAASDASAMTSQVNRERPGSPIVNQTTHSRAQQQPSRWPNRHAPGDASGETYRQINKSKRRISQ
jgi:hypothetical protein